MKKVTNKDVLPLNFAKAFKPADIRGIYPLELNEEVVYRVARAFVQLYDLKEVIVGRDMRISSPALCDAFVNGTIDQGAIVTDLGMVDTPAVYFASGTYNKYAAMLTASHNPKQYNGIKLVKAGAIPLTETSGLGKIQKMVVRNKFVNSVKKGQIKKKAIMKEYSTYLRSSVSIKIPRKIKLVVDAGNGMGTILAPIISKGFPVEMYPLFFELDGTFPNRDSNPTLSKSQKYIRREIRRVQPDFGVAFDGDVDRVAFFDEKGKAINSAVIGALIAKLILQKSDKKEKFVYTVFTSKSYYETIQKYGGTPILARVGHSFIKEKMRKHDAIFGCEHSAHFYFKGNFFADSGILALLKVLEVFADVLKDGTKFSQLVKEFDLYHQTEEVLIKVKDKKKVLTSMIEFYKKEKTKKLHTFDGLYVEFDEYWFDIKESVTEDALKLIVESVDKKTMNNKEKELLAQVSKYNK